MTQVEQGRGAAEAAADDPSPGAPRVGDLLADRYELAAHISEDAVGRQVWRGIDVILRRPVAVVLRYPGGERAAEMLQAAVAASRVVHPNLVGVYDAVDEADRAYVVREWVEGASLRETVAAEGPLDPARATTIAHAVAAAVAAVHATGMRHGNIHPGTVLIAQDGRVVLADARADRETTTGGDVRAVGGVLYFALTGHWPAKELTAAPGAPDAVRDSAGHAVAPRQMRAGVPDHIDAFTSVLLDMRGEPPPADLVAGDLSRFDSAAADALLDEPSPLRLAADSAVALGRTGTRSSLGKLTAGVAALVVLACVGTLLGLRLVGGGTVSGGAGRPAQAAPTASAEAVDPRPIPLSAAQVRIVDPGGDRTELDEADKTVDGRTSTAWETHRYRSPLTAVKPGMGILVDLGGPRRVSSIRAQFGSAGADVSLRHGDSDPGASAAGDRAVLRGYGKLTDPVTTSGTWAYGDFDPNATYRYLLLWFTALPDDGTGGYQLAVQEIIVEGP
ncbi:MAG TPA: protein kinase family protein [Pilimelia sp.]|nr:protein kinase family protein [Pilimelia sp.]